MSKKDGVRDDISKAFFGTSSETGWRSVKTYYEELSNNLVSLGGTVSEWYEPNVLSTSVTSTNETISLVQSASNWYFTNNPSDSRLNYDINHSGALDGVVLIYAAPDYSQLSSMSSNMWQYVFWTQDGSANVANPQVNNFLWSSYDTMYGSNKAQTRTGHTYAGGDTSNCSIDTHTFIHESGHMFGLEDYYDYSGSYYPAGGFSMQDYNIGSHDPFSAMALGWADPYIPTSTTTIELHPFQTSHELILLTPSWNQYNSAFDEYLLLELYTPTGLNELDCTYQYRGRYPTGPSYTGIRLWHVDARLSYLNSAGTSIYAPGQYSTSVGNVILSMSNTYGTTNAHSSIWIRLFEGTYDNYQYFNLLQLIRNDVSDSYCPQYTIYHGDLFKDGSSFNMSTYSSQFVNGTKLNSNVALGWSFSVSISGSGNNAVASVTCTKA